MRQPIFILALTVLAAAALAVGAGWLAKSVCCAQGKHEDPLDWLRTEYRLSAEQLKQVRQLHDGYLPECMNYCQRIDDLKSRLKAAIRDQGPAGSEVENLLKEIGITRAQCQTAMLKHFVEVSRAMAPEQGKRYLAEMQRLTLFAHENFEASMSPGKPERHGHQ
jgi:hypothetical protein